VLALVERGSLRQCAAGGRASGFWVRRRSRACSRSPVKEFWSGRAGPGATLWLEAEAQVKVEQDVAQLEGLHA